MTRIDLNYAISDDQLTQLDHAVADADLPYGSEEQQSLFDLASEGKATIENEELANFVIDFLGKTMPRIIVWKNGKAVVNKYGKSPLDIEADPAGRHESVEKLVDKLLNEDDR